MIVTALGTILKDMFRDAADATIERGWSGVLGVSRHWKVAGRHGPKTRLGFAGGYVGTGATATNLAGRMLAHLVLGANTERAVMPWVNRTVRRWEVEPLRWIAVQGMHAAYH